MYWPPLVAVTNPLCLFSWIYLACFIFHALLRITGPQWRCNSRQRFRFVSKNVSPFWWMKRSRPSSSVLGQDFATETPYSTTTVWQSSFGNALKRRVHRARLHFDLFGAHVGPLWACVALPYEFPSWKRTNKLPGSRPQKSNLGRWELKNDVQYIKKRRWTKRSEKRLTYGTRGFGPDFARFGVASVGGPCGLC